MRKPDDNFNRTKFLVLLFLGIVAIALVKWWFQAP